MRIEVPRRPVRLALHLLCRDQRGATGALIAIVIGAGALTGMGAMVLDVGQLYQQRAELQSGADAAALAVAKSCATGTCAPSVATALADANSSTGYARVDLVCGSGSGSLTQCPASTGTLTDCPAAPAAGISYLDVHTSTLTASGSSLLPPVFARTLLGNGNYQGTTVYACAQAEWGPPQSAAGLAFTISACEWYGATSDGTSFAPPPPATPPASYDQILQYHGTSHSGCPQDNASGADGPGLFGWTTDTTGNCQTLITTSGYPGSTGSSASQSCTAALAAAATRGSPPVLIPVYTAISGQGNNGTYTLLGFAAFVLTGYSVPGSTAADWLNPAHTCTGSQDCIFGYFTQALVPSTGSIGGTNLGADIIKLTG